MPSSDAQPDIAPLLAETLSQSLLADLLSHPEAVVSLHELDYFNPTVTTTQIHIRLNELTAHDVVEKHTLKDVQPGEPETFYATTPDTPDLLEEHDATPATLPENIYTAIDTPRYQSYRNLRRPPCD